MDRPWSIAAPPRAAPRVRWALKQNWTLEQKLHIALAAVVIVGWALVYMTLMRVIERPEAARDAPARTAISANLPPR
jgi:hypothetical protein